MKSVEGPAWAGWATRNAALSTSPARVVRIGWNIGQISNEFGIQVSFGTPERICSSKSRRAGFNFIQRRAVDPGLFTRWGPSRPGQARARQPRGRVRLARSDSHLWSEDILRVPADRPAGAQRRP